MEEVETGKRTHSNIDGGVIDLDSSPGASNKRCRIVGFEEDIGSGLSYNEDNNSKTLVDYAGV